MSLLIEELVWAPQPKQIDLIECPIEDVLFGGARGGGKTDGLLGDWATHAEDYAQAARGIFFRKSYPELEEVERRCHEIFPAFGAHWQATKRTWLWPNKATLRLRYLERDSEADLYQGHSYTWVGWDELGNWPTPTGVDKLRACLRSPHGVPCVTRGSANPGGVGHNWVKARYIDPAPAMTPFWTEDRVGDTTIRVQRCFIPATLEDNAILMTNDPSYWQRVVAAAGGNEALVKAWRFGLWDIVAGGMLDDLWNAGVHVVEPFDIPRGWRIRRAFDWGSSAPFSCGWWAQSDGETPVGPHRRVYPRHTRFRIAELYGWNGKPNEGLRLSNTDIAKRIKALEDDAPFKGRVQPGPADTQIFDVTNGASIAADMAVHGIRWVPAQKGPGSRRQGAQQIRKLLQAGRQWPMEEPGLFVFSTCRQFLRTVPVIPRDKLDADDVDSNSEDHIYDEMRYECSTPFASAATRDLNF
jgi:hypothetical protein